MPQRDRPALTGRVGPPPGHRERRPAQHAEPGRLPQVATAATVLAAGGALTLLSAQPAAAASRGELAVAFAAQEKGSPYQWGAEGPAQFDCSGLVQFVYHRLGVTLPRTAALQARAVKRVNGKQLRKGDIVFFFDKTGHVFHNGIYAGRGMYWNAPETGQKVSLRPIRGSRWVAGRPKGLPVAKPVVLKVGSHGALVLAVQKKLRIPADGTFGPGTAAAVQRFQRAHKLLADGEVGPTTRAKLFPVVHKRFVSIPANAPLLRVGARGQAVMLLQKLLHQRADGEFGPRTRTAVVRFQKAVRLTPDGEVGRRTWKALEKAANR